MSVEGMESAEKKDPGKPREWRGAEVEAMGVNGLSRPLASGIPLLGALLAPRSVLVILYQSHNNCSRLLVSRSFLCF